MVRKKIKLKKGFFEASDTDSCCKPLLHISGENLSRLDIALLKMLLERSGFEISSCAVKRGLHGSY